MKKKIHYIDIAKALAIIAMVSQHVEMGIEVIVSYETIAPYARLQNYVILTWIMPIFFVITGYCSNYNKSFKQFITSLIISIGLPIFFFDIIPANINNFSEMPLAMALAQIPITLERFIRYSFWFLRTLFVAKILYWFICKYINGYYKIIFLVTLYLIASAAVTTGHGAHGCHSIFALNLVAIGNWIKKNDFLNSRLFNFINIFACVTTLTIMWTLNYSPPVFTETLKFTVIDIIWFPIVSITGSVTVLFICKTIEKCKILEFVGKYSLVIYCFHYYIKNWLDTLLKLNPDASLTHSLFFLLSYTIVLIAICCTFAYIVDRPYLRVIIGKKP